MVLTEEQKERIRKNRERALEIQKRRREELEGNKGLSEGKVASRKAISGDEPPRKKFVTGILERKASDEGKLDGTDDGGEEEEDSVELEEFEVGASKYVTKKEAMKMYLLPEGTLAICKFEEKPNPHNKKFQPMKLYDRAQVRRLSRERFGGLHGLIEERKRREEKRFQKDLDETKNLFRK